MSLMIHRASARNSHSHQVFALNLSHHILPPSLPGLLVAFLSSFLSALRPHRLLVYPVDSTLFPGQNHSCELPKTLPSLGESCGAGFIRYDYNIRRICKKVVGMAYRSLGHREKLLADCLS